TATDTCPGASVSGSRSDGKALADPYPVGPTTLTWTAIDAAGNEATCAQTVIVTAAYAWSGVLQPINADGSSVFKAGSTVPVKFALAGASACLTGLAATLGYAKVSDGVAGGVNEAVSTSQATAGNLFRYDASAGQYI